MHRTGTFLFFLHLTWLQTDECCVLFFFSLLSAPAPVAVARKSALYRRESR